MKKKPILIKGERLIEPIIKRSSFPRIPEPTCYAEKKDKIIRSLNNIKQISKSEENFLPNEIIICAKMEEKMLAKSHRPDFLTKRKNMKLIGARKLKQINYSNSSEVKENKVYFFRTSITGIDNLISILENNLLCQTDINAFCKLSNIELLNASDKIFGLDDKDVASLNIEIVLHPLEKDFEIAIEKIKENVEECIIKNYDNGPTFILAKINASDINNIAKYNFLRTIHPARTIHIPKFNRGSILGAPKLNLINNTTESKIIKVGVFDGGVSLDNDLLKGLVNNYDISSLPSERDGIVHGTAVCGAVLFGELNNFGNDDILEVPNIRVESFRVLPEINEYKIIDNIEYIVKSRKDINIYNISFGPPEPIWDDTINRFTYVLDELAYNNNVLFCVAVGNDGNLEEPFNRIQSPADIVNGLGIGAYSIYNGEVYKADYSCIGAGREGSKIKPDFLAFGGDSRTPFHAVGVENNTKCFTAGTSFATPVVTGNLGKLMAYSKEVNSLMARTLAIHTANKKINNIQLEGYGILSESLINMLECTDKKVTILFSGELNSTKYIKLPIPLPSRIKSMSGTVKIEYSIVNLTDINGLDVDGYTLSCIEDTFFPNSNKFEFKKEGHKTKIIDLSKNYILAEELINDGFEQAKFPRSASPKYKSERFRRKELQWDTCVKKYVSKNTTSLDKPFLSMHCISRTDNNFSKLKFCVAITVTHQKYDGDLYEDIVTEYPLLAKLEEDIDIDIDIDIES